MKKLILLAMAFLYLSGCRSQSVSEGSTALPPTLPPRDTLEGSFVPTSTPKPLPRRGADEGLWRRGEYITCFTDADVRYQNFVARFDIVEIGGRGDWASAEMLAAFRSQGVKMLLFYDWLPAGYYWQGGGNEDFDEYIHAHREQLTLNPAGPFPMAAYYQFDARDYYFDFGVETFRAYRAAYLQRIGQEKGYDGIFLDWANDRFLEEPSYQPMRERYNQRHPDMPYPQAAQDFLRRLHETDLVIVTNQAYRSPRYFLPYATFDMVESMSSTDAGRATQFERFEIVLEIADELNQFRAQYNPNVRYVFMNYAGNGKTIRPKDIIHYNFAIAKLVAAMEYTEFPNQKDLEYDEVYFANLGLPTQADYRAIQDGSFVRDYENGFVLAGFSAQPQVEIRFGLLNHTALYDVYGGAYLPVQNGYVDLSIETSILADDDRYYYGRVYLYAPESAAAP